MLKLKSLLPSVIIADVLLDTTPDTRAWLEMFLLQTAIRQKAPPLGCSGQTIQPIRLKFEREHEIVKILTFRLINLFLNQIL